VGTADEPQVLTVTAEKIWKGALIDDFATTDRTSVRYWALGIAFPASPEAAQTPQSDAISLGWWRDPSERGVHRSALVASGG